MDRLELLIYDTVGDWWEGTRAADVARELLAHPHADVDVYINSDGGDVYEGVAIYTALARHAARVVTHVDGKALSIASAIAQAGDERRIARGAMLMVHEPWGYQQGTADDMRRYAEFLDENADGLAGIYAASSGQSAETVEAWMKAETWFGADAAVEAGLADTVVERASAVLAPALAHARAQATPGGVRRTAYALRTTGHETTKKTNEVTMADTAPKTTVAWWNKLFGSNAQDEAEVMLGAVGLKAEHDRRADFEARCEALTAEAETLRARIAELEAEAAEASAEAAEAAGAEDEAFLAQAVADFRILPKDLDAGAGWRAQMAGSREACRTAILSIPAGTHNPASRRPASGADAGENKGRARVAAATKVAA